ncbi:MAG: hypothetical protein R3B74_04070 [Nitrospirales bacterium]|nr:hypothetical protein [Nitrospirales bacterium]
MLSTSTNKVKHIESTFPEPTERSESAVLRPFYFIVVFWGETFRDYLCDFGLPSLLAPNNIPAIQGVGVSFSFVRLHRIGWRCRKPDFLGLKEYIEPYFIEIGLPPEGKSGCEHMGVGHKLAAQMAFEDKAFGVFLTPDLMVSDGTIRALKKCAYAGIKVVLTAALRFGEEPLFENLRSLGILQKGDRHSKSGLPLSISGRQMVKAGIRSFHSQTKRYEWEAPYFSSFPCACWWDVPGEEGVVLHSLSWAPFLCDYAAVETHDTSTFDDWTLDGDYIFQNFKNPNDMYIVKDSDEVMLVSWAPLADRPQKVSPNFLKGLPVVGEWIKGGILRAALLSGIFDSLKREIFFLPVMWHGGTLSPNWEKRVSECQQVLTRYVGDLDPDSMENPFEKYNSGTGGLVWSVRNMIHRVWLGFLVAMGRIWFIGSNLFHARERLKARMQEALQGDGIAQKRILQRFGMIWKMIRGVPMRHF